MNHTWFLHYPVWELGRLGGGFWIALIATIHVYIAHFAVGGGLFLVLTERKARREDDADMLSFVQAHARFFLLLTVVLGALTGVGIWFTISVLSPAATSILIHYFLFGWATEWVFFLGEIIVLYLYYKSFDDMDAAAHLRLGWLYFILGWLSLFVVNGIITAMLTPGEWLTTRNFWDGFFNPSFWPATFFRTAMAGLLAGLFGFVTTLTGRGAAVRDSMLAYCAKWMVISLVLLLIFGFWYLSAIPFGPDHPSAGNSPEAARALGLFLKLCPVLLIAAVLMTVRLPLRAKQGMAAVLLAAGFAYMGAFEYARESARRPYLIFGEMYSSGLREADLPAVRAAGLLASTRWSRFASVSDVDPLEAGAEVFKFACSACHSVGGVMNDILPLTEAFPRAGMDAFLSGMGRIYGYMPPFPGNKAERQALAAYITQGLHGKTETDSAVAIAERPVEIPPFDADGDEYVLLAWNAKGMHCISDNEKFFSFAVPGNDLFALLIRRGESPERIAEGVRITYALDAPFSNPAGRSDFWRYSEALTGKDLPENTGLQGNGPAGEMTPDPEAGCFTVRGVPAVPYTDEGAFDPYPMATIAARDAAGNLLAETRIPVPVSTEMGCRTCHGGGWRVADRAGLSDATASDILRRHDKRHGTRLLKDAAAGRPARCQSCHGEKGEHLNFSAAIHGFHASYLTERWADACAACHPGNLRGGTRAFRGIHNAIGLDCMSCHGTMEDHALSLLRAEQAAGREAAGRLMAPLPSRVVPEQAAVLPRRPWVQEPDCLNCHVDFQPPETIETFNQWTAEGDGLFRHRAGDAGVPCMACHGSTHALHPAHNPYGADLDNIPPMQYQGAPYPMGSNRRCDVCHTREMEAPIHHPNMLTAFRNVR